MRNNCLTQNTSCKGAETPQKMPSGDILLLWLGVNNIKGMKLTLKIAVWSISKDMLACRTS